jgi:hypothetical protein
MSMVSTANTNTCIYPEPGDTGSFGFSLAVDEGHIIVGDSGANRVSIYQRNSAGNWFRVRIIECPEDSPFTVIGRGFGSSLALDGDTLVISASAQKFRPRMEGDFDSHEKSLFSFSPPYQHHTNDAVRYAGAVYQTTLNEVSSIQRIDVPIEGELAGDSIAADMGNIAYSVKSISHSYTVLVSGKQSYCLQAFGKFALKGQRLAVVQGSKILLFDLQSPEKYPQKILIPFPTAPTKIDMSDDLIAIDSGAPPSNLEIYCEYEGVSMPVMPQSFIFRLKDGESYIVEGYGKVTLNKNLLVRSICNGGGYSGWLDVFSLHDLSEPKKISRELGSIECTYLTNNMLVTTRRLTPRQQIKRRVKEQAIYIDELPE